MSTPVHDEALLTPDQLVAWFRERGHTISANRIREQLNAGVIPGYKVGGHWLTPLPWLRRWLYGPGNDVATVPVETATPIPFVARKRAAS